MQRRAAASPLMKAKDVARALAIEEQTLATWRCDGAKHLPFVRVGSSVRYRSEDVAAFIEKNLQAA